MTRWLRLSSLPVRRREEKTSRDTDSTTYTGAYPDAQEFWQANLP